jgi:molecular chaperone HtpG
MSATETKPFQAEVKELLGLMIHSLYSHKEIFLRELISNASDALDKLRFEALTRPELLGADPRLRIRLAVDEQARRLSLSDNGIGMSREEVVENLGVIARSGTRKFLEALRERGADRPELIGQFGVGFYSSFMVAERVTVETWRAGEAKGVRWSSRGDGEYTLEELDGGSRGTTIHLDLRPVEAPDAAGEEALEHQDFSDAEALRGLVRKYSDFVEWPIEMAASHFEGDGTLKRSTAEDGVEVVTLNSQRPLWMRPKDEIKPEEYAQFYKHLTHEWTDPLETVHFKVEGASEYTALLFLPQERPFDLFSPERDKSRISLYVRRVFVMAECEPLLPTWLRFVRGVVDSSDLPLNVSREILQQNRALGQIQKRLVKKTLDTLGGLLANRREDYAKFWASFGAILKEGVVMEREQRETVAALMLCASTKDDALVTLDECIARLPAGQEKLYVLRCADVESGRRSPHVEALRARGGEALLFTDAIDEWLLDSLTEYKGKQLVALDKAELEDESEAAKFDREKREREYRSVLERLETELSEQVQGVRLSSRLVDSPAVLVDDPSSVGPHMERMMRQTGRTPPKRKRILELNAQHPLMERLKALHDTPGDAEKLKEWSDLLLGQALLAEGSPLPDPTRFSRLLSSLMLSAAK